MAENKRTLLKWTWLNPAVALGLYAGRLISEWGRFGLLGAMLITLFCLIIASLIMRQRPLTQTWPVCFLLIYVLYPEPEPWLAFSAAAFAITIAVLALDIKRIALSERARLWSGILFIGIGFFVLYLVTLAPDLLPADNGEFQLVAARLGVAHPPGFPLYSILVHLMTRLPIGATAAYKVNLLSAVTSTLTLILIYLSLYQLTGHILAGLVAALALGTATTFWAQATTANIRSLTALFTGLAIFALLKASGYRISQKSGQEGGGQEKEQSDFGRAYTGPAEGKLLTFYLFLFFLALGLGITHHGSLIFIAPIFVLVLFLARPGLLAPHRWPIILLAAGLTLLPFLYLVQRGAARAPGAPPDLMTPGGFLNHILARGFRGDLLYFDELSLLWQRLKVMGNVYAFQFSTPLLLALVAGLVLMLWHDRLLALLIGGSLFVFTLVAATYRAPQTVEYLLPAYVLAAVSIGYLTALIRRSGADSSGSELSFWNLLSPVLIAILIMASLNQLFSRYPSYWLLHQDTTARDYALPLLEQAPPEAVLLADWHWATPLWYLQEVEGVRPDVDVQFVFPTGEEYAATWARRIGEEFSLGRPVIATHFDEATYVDLPEPLPIEEAFLFTGQPLSGLPDGYTSTPVILEDSIQISGQQLESSLVEAGDELVLTLAWQPAGDYNPPQNLFLHLVDEEGQVYAQQDLPAQAQTNGLTLTQFRLTPLLETPPGSYQLVIGTYSNDDPDTPEPVRVPLVDLAIGPSSTPPFTQNNTNLHLVGDENRRLVGYDWENTLPGNPRLYLHWQDESGYRTEAKDVPNGIFQLPAWYGPWGIPKEKITLRNDPSSQYVPFGQGIVWTGDVLAQDESWSAGERIELEQFFASSRPVLRDLIVSLRLVGYEEDGFHWNWWDLDDGVPAMGAIPTLKWIGGSTVRDPKWPLIADDAWSDQIIEPLLRIYDAFTGRPLPILDDRFNQEIPWVPLGKYAIGE